MYNSKPDSDFQLPSAAQLWRSTAIAAVVAVALLISVILPSEYGVDLTGAGRLLGLTEMGQIKQQLAEEAEADRQAALALAQTDVAPVAASSAEPTPQVAAQSAPISVPVEAPVAAPASWIDEVEFQLAPTQGAEWKLVMAKGAKAEFEWQSSGGGINFDTHGDGLGNSISYQKGRGVKQDSGEITAAFAGNHGWFFRNRTKQTVTVTLRTRGDYSELKRAI